MSAPSELSEPLEHLEYFSVIKVEATVVTGLESVAKEECFEKLGVKAEVERGRIFFEIPIDKITEVFHLKGVDNIYVVLNTIEDFKFPPKREALQERLNALVGNIHWTTGIEAWRRAVCPDRFTLEDVFYWIKRLKESKDDISSPLQPIELNHLEPDTHKLSQETDKCDVKLNHPAPSTPLNQDDLGQNSLSDSDSATVNASGDQPSVLGEIYSGLIKEVVSKQTNQDSVKTDEKFSDWANRPKFRVTCNRSGDNHNFTSMEAAAIFGGAVNDYFCWKVDMKNFDIEVVLNINSEKVYTCISLTKESLHRRNLEHFGPTSLRATIAYNMLRLCNIAPGDIVCDPMCGGGSIPIEAAINWPDSYHICGDNHDLALPRTFENVEAVNKKRSECNKGLLHLDICKWDVCCLPLKNNYVDVFITDLPFGKRIGSKQDNRILYPKLLLELARVCKFRTGRAVLLTQDKKTMSRVIGKLGYLWKQIRACGVNVGGLAACIYILQRTLKEI